MVIDQIKWYEGMLLSAHHFQYLDKCQKDNFNFHISSNLPFHYGIIEYKYDPAQILNGVFIIDMVKAIMPDGTIINYDRNVHDHVVSFDLSEYVDSLYSKNLRLYIAFPKNGSDRFFNYQLEKVQDDNTQENPIDITLMLPNIKIMPEKFLSSSLVYMPIADIGVEKESYTITEYTPPILSINMDYPLGEKITDLLSLLRQNASLIQRKMNSKISFDYFNKLKQGLAAIMPGLLGAEAILYSDMKHPFLIYKELVSMLASITPLNFTETIPVPPKYDHLDINFTFDKIISYIDDFIKFMKDEFTKALFEFDEENQNFKITMKPTWESKEIIIGIKSGESMTEDETIIWARQAIIASKSTMRSAIDKRVCGAARSCDIDHEKVIAPNGVILCKISANDDFISCDEELYILNPNTTICPSEIYLYVDE